MISFWKEALKVTGPVAVAGFLLALTIRSIFREDVVHFFGSEKLYYLAALLLILLFSSLVIAIRSKYNRPTCKSSIRNRTDINRSTVNGDIVTGNKSTYNSDTREQ